MSAFVALVAAVVALVFSVLLVIAGALWREWGTVALGALLAAVNSASIALNAVMLA